MRTCVIEMHMEISQEPLWIEIFKDNARVAHGHPVVRACAVAIHMDMSQESCGPEIDKENAKCLSRPGPAFCATLRSRNAHGHVTRATLY